MSRKVDTNAYIEGEKINYGRLLTDEVLAADRMLVEAAKKNMDVAGTLGGARGGSSFTLGI